MPLTFNAAAAARLVYLALVIVTGLLLFVSCVFLLSQAVRTAPNKNWTRNVNAVVIGGAYILVVGLTVVLLRAIV